jgi:hypothetical protein
MAYNNTTKQLEVTLTVILPVSGTESLELQERKISDQRLAAKKVADLLKDTGFEAWTVEDVQRRTA